MFSLKAEKKPREYKTLEARFGAELLAHFTASVPKGSMYGLLLSSMGDLMKIIDESPEARVKAREVLDYVQREWPERVKAQAEKGEPCQG